MTNTFEVSVRAIKDDDGRTIINILLPKDQPKASALEISHVLAVGIGALIKSCGEKDHEALSEIIKHLEDEFVSIDSFKDVVVDKNIIEK